MSAKAKVVDPKPGSLLKFSRLPTWVDQLPRASQEVSRYCVGGTFPLAEVDEQGLLVLDVSRELDPFFGGVMNDIRVEAEYLEYVAEDDR